MPKIVDEQTREATRRHIIHEAAHEFARLGFDQANINVIAEKAGIGKGTIYLYFANKRELFLDMLRYIAQAQLSTIRTALAKAETLEARLKDLFCAFVSLAEEDSDAFNVYMSSLYGVNRAFRAEATRLLQDYVACIALILEQSRARGEINCSDVTSAALMVLSLTESYVLSARVLGSSTQALNQQASAVARFILQGLQSV